MGKTLGSENSQELLIPIEKTENVVEEGINVVLTAFDPFFSIVDSRERVRPLKVTACWESIRLIPSRGVGYRKPVNVYCYRLRNIYDFISKQIRRCWEKHSPALVIITGQYTTSECNELVFERVATNTHILGDEMRYLARSDCCTNTGPEILMSQLDLESVVQKLKEGNTGFIGKVATTPSGFYLCDYAYYNSLHINPARTACIRVPEKQVIRPEEMADVLSLCINLLLDQLEDANVPNPSIS